MSLPTTEPAKRLGILFGRRLGTAWSEKEIKAYKQLFKSGCFTDLNDLALVERYTIAQRRKGNNGHHRRDLITLLNNFMGELDRAREWNLKHGGSRGNARTKKEYVHYEEISEEQAAKNKAFIAPLMAELRQRLKMNV